MKPELSQQPALGMIKYPLNAGGLPNEAFITVKYMGKKFWNLAYNYDILSA